MEKKGVVIFTYSYPFGTGETFFQYELEALSSCFSPVHLFPLHYGGNLTAREVPGHVTFSEPLIRFDIKKDKLKLLKKGFLVHAPILFALKEFWHYKVFLHTKWLTRWMSSTLITRILLSGENLKNILGRTGPRTVIYFYWGDKSSGILPHLKQIMTNRMVVRFHGSDLFEEINGGYIPYRKVLVQHLDYAVFVSETGMKYLQNKYSSFSFGASVFRLGVPARQFMKGSTDGLFRMVSCSHLIPLKRVHLILEAIGQLPYKIIWTHFGSGPLFSEIQEKAKKLPDSVEVNLKGEVDNMEIIGYYASNPVDLFINLSLSEGIPVSIMEAFSFGIPALATNVGGTREIVDENTGILIPQETLTGEIAQKISGYCQLNEETRETFRERAYACWELKYNAPENFRKFSEFLASLE
jgi:glycosyltransferase involved in cell wall biosynthesis